MFKFHSGLYTDVRIEKKIDTIIDFTQETLDNITSRETQGAFIRVFDGKRWYYSSITDLENIQNEIDNLSKLTTNNPEIENNPQIKKIPVNKKELFKYENSDVRKIPVEKKVNVLKTYFSFMINQPLISMWKASYYDQYVLKEFYSSKGSELKFDKQYCGVRFEMNFKKDNSKFDEVYSYGTENFNDLYNIGRKLAKSISKSVDFLLNSKDIKKGNYKVILSPMAAGIFAHESFGHKSEADFMLNDEEMKNEWKIGKQVGPEILSIIDDGNIDGIGYTPFDDEGISSDPVYLIKNGVLAGRLHSSRTAGELEENTTGNARACGFTFEPIVRMTTTYIKPGKLSKKELFESIDEGVYIDTVKHGSGMSTFTMAPSLAYYIKDGQIQYPVKISVITGNVFETLQKIDGLSNKLKIISFIGGGCGKMEQYPLPVGFGGPYVRISDMKVL
ncbi:MAG: TldD/PmbA family protein [Candidatus Muiribacteriota bacterium]